MYQENISNTKINQNINYPPYSKKKIIKPNYLTESSYAQIQSALRKNYFNRLQSISVNKRSNYIYDDEKNMNKSIDEYYERPTKFVAKQIMFSNKIRKDNFNKIKKNPKKLNYNASESYLTNEIKTLDKDDYKTIFDENENRKSPLPKIKKEFRDEGPLYYDLNYIDEVEKKYIKPYLSNNSIIYRDYIENKKSKAPFNFIIG